MRNLRKWHAWVSVIVAIPIFITILSGNLLILRSHLSFIQPKKTQKVEVKENSLASIPEVIRKAQEIYQPPFDRKDISSINFYPSKGYFSVRTKEKRELRLHGSTLEVLAEGPKLTGWLIRIHEGSIFSPFVRDFIFFPSALCLLFLWISGVIIFFQPRLRNWKKKFT